MTIEELNKLIQEELGAYLNEADEAGEEGGDDIEVTTDEPGEPEEDDALGTLRQIFDMLKPIVEPEEEEEEEPEVDMEDEGGEDDGDEEELEEDLKEDFSTETLPQIAQALGVGIPVVKMLLPLAGVAATASAATAIEKLQNFMGKLAAKKATTDEAVGYPNYKADQVQKVKADATDVNQSLNESVEKTIEETSNDLTDRFKKLANIKK